MDLGWNIGTSGQKSGKKKFNGEYCTNAKKKKVNISSA